jgi:hypothetical protein
MADFRTDTSAIKVEPTKGMSLADMLNVQKSSYELSKLKELYPSVIAEQQAKSKQAQIQSNLAEQTAPLELKSKQQSTESSGMDLQTKKQQAIANGYVAKIFDPLVVQATRDPNSVDKNQLVQNIQKWGIQQGKEAGVDQETTMNLIKPYIEIAQNNPGQLQDYLKQRHILGLTPESRTSAMGTALQIQPDASQPAQTSMNQNGVNPKQMNMPEHSQPVSTPYPVRNPSVPYLPAPSEQADKESGFKYRNNLVSRQSTLSTDKRNIDEVITKARELEKEAYLPTSGWLGSAERLTSQFLGTEQGIRYKELSKDLANAQISNIKASGGSLETDSGKQLVAMANGDVTYPPKVLIEIARRTKADMTNLDMQATAAQKFADRFGDNNMKKFQQEWSKNADSKVFQVMNIAKDTNLTQEEKLKETEKLFGPVGSNERKVSEEKYRNLLKLQQTGTLQ